MNTLLQDLKFSFRLLAKTPGFTATAILVLALGIGVNTAMFSVIHALTFSQRPFAEPERVVQLYTQDKKEPTNYRAFSYAAYQNLRQRTDLFAGVLAHNLAMIAVGEDSDNRRALSALVSSDYFRVLGVAPLRGRVFTAEEERPGANIPVVIVSHLYWRKTGGAPDIVGSTIRVNARPFTVVGIAPENFTGTMMFIGPEFYFPLGVADALLNNLGEDAPSHALTRDDSFSLFLVARLQPGVTLESARGALQGVATSLAAALPASYQDKNLTAGPLPRLGTNTSPANESSVKLFGAVLMTLAGAVFLTVCLNLAGLLLARGQARRKEFAVRLALGAARGRIVRQLLTEGLVLSLAGSLLGLLLAVSSTDLLASAISARLPIAVFLPGFGALPVLGATLGFCGFAVLAFAFGPAWKLSRANVLTDLKQQAGEDVVERRRRWMPRHPLLVAQIALSLGLLVAAGLFVRLAVKLANTETGYHADNAVVAEVDASLGGFDEARSRQIYRDTEQRLAALPGVRAASIGAGIPYGVVHFGRSVMRAGITPAKGSKPATAAEGRAFSADWNSVGVDYFTVMGLSLLRGRAFTAAETAAPDANRVAIIDEALARKLWPGGDALGQRLRFASVDKTRAISGHEPKDDSIEVVGIVSTAKNDLFDRDPHGTVYAPFAQGFVSNVHFHVLPAVSSQAAARALIETVRRELQQSAPGVPIFKVRTFQQHFESAVELWFVRLSAMLFALFGGFAMLIAVVGIYGIKSYAVARRTREIGIRMALGAEPSRVRNLVLREGLATVALGLTIGMLLGLGIGKALGRVFVGVASFDPLSFAIAAAGLFAAAMLACWLPARKATQVSPLQALRTE